MTKLISPITLALLAWLAWLALPILLCSCGTPPYSASGAPPPTKGKELAAYSLGQSDAVKRQYWILRNMQMGKQKGEEVAYKPRYYTFNIQPDPQANINKVPYNITLPIVE